MQSIYPAIQLHILGTLQTPEIIYNREVNEISISGKSHPENSKSFYTPIFEILKNIISISDEKIKIKIHLEYINSSSCMAFLDFFKLINPLFQNGKIIMVKWLHEKGDLDTIERIKLFQEMVNYPIVALESNKDL